MLYYYWCLDFDRFSLNECFPKSFAFKNSTIRPLATPLTIAVYFKTVYTANIHRQIKIFTALFSKGSSLVLVASNKSLMAISDRLSLSLGTTGFS